jgi:hypothetical protein
MSTRICTIVFLLDHEWRRKRKRRYTSDRYEYGVDAHYCCENRTSFQIILSGAPSSIAMLDQRVSTEMLELKSLDLDQD